MSQKQCLLEAKHVTRAQQQWADAELGDARRTQRAVAVGAALAAAADDNNR